MDEQEKKVDVLDTEDVVDVDVREMPEGNEQRVEERRDGNQVPAPIVEDAELAPLFEQTDAEKFRSHWLDIQSTFVDDPRDAVRKADALVDDVIHSITQTFAQKRTALENQWNSGDDASTEDLRLAIKRYRSFFNGLLSLES